MSVINGANAVVGSSTQYQISRSLRFNSADSAYLNRTPGSAGNRKTWTWSGWVKKSDTVGSTPNQLFSARTGSDATYTLFYFDGSPDANSIKLLDNGATLISSSKYRDPSAWYHVVIALDTTQATSSNRVKIYVNGVQVTAFSTATYPSQNADLNVNSTATHLIGQQASGQYFNGYLTEINFIDGQALTPSSFGETDTDTGVWKPKKYTGSYGTNGFYLNFSDNSGTTSTTLGKDSSGNGNNWTPNNFSVTAGAGNDSLVDTPTNYGTDTGVGGEVRGNYATLNPLDNGGNTVSNGNLVVNTATGFDLIRSTMFLSSGKWYWEVTCDDCGEGFVGISSASEGLNTRGAETANSATIRTTNGDLRTNATNSAYGSAVADGNVMMFALDMDAGKFWAGKSGTWFNSGNPAAGTNAGKTGLTVAVSPSISVYDNEDYTANFGQRPFAYTAPSGFKALCTQNLPEPTIVDGGDYFNTVLYTGNATAGRSVTGVGFAPDLVWIKNRSAAQSNILSNKLGANGNYLISNNTDFESVVTNVITSLDSDGFTVGSNATTNGSGNAMVAWNWKAGGTPATTNTAGTITSTVSVNTTSGFSIVNYTGTGANATVGHGLGVAPSMVIVKARSNVTDWIVYSSILGKSAGLILNSTGASFSNTDYWGTGGVTSTVFGLKGGGFSHNVSGYTYVAYCFAPVAGYSAFGSFVGNGNADGPFVYTGFKPAFVMCKGTTTTTHWVMSDSKRPGYNVTPNALFANLSNAEATDRQIDLLSNGFKLRQANLSPNDSGVTFIYMAFAETPFSLSLAR